MADRIVIVGGGVAAQRCAFALRRLGFEGAVELVSAELEAPYDRTLLSKDLLAGDELAPCVPLSPESAYADEGISMRLGVRAVRLDAGGSRVVLSDGDALPYDRLVICSGGRPVLPPALACPGILTLRDAADLPRVHDALARARHLIVIGGGFIGGEVASAAVTRFAPVTLVEAANAPLAPVLGDEVAERVAGLHRRAGVRLECGVPVRGVQRSRAGFEVALADGRVLPADAVLVGVGMTPNVDWLADSGLELDDGIVTDAACRTSVPGVLAAGDCARWLHPRYGVHLRAEHWDTAIRHGEAAAAAALGSDEPFAPLPYFWSDQHGTKLQWVGHAPAWDEVEIEDDAEPGFVARYRSAGRLAGVLTVGRPRACAAARRELQNQTPKEVGSL
jgi:3-phenylpropionate/trans-cinnamate dioxygenase ferredoxin reductase subunit